MSEPAKLFTDGAAYERMMGRWSRAAGAEFLAWLALPRGLHCLDVGCGNGAFTEELIARAAPASVAAADPSEEQIAHARTRPGAKAAQFRIGDAQKLPFEARSFDAALMALVLVFLSDPAKAVAEMARVVRPGGWAAAYMWDVPAAGSPLRPLYTAMKTLGIAPAAPPSPDASRGEVMEEMWKKAGLQSVESRVIRIPVTFVDFDDFWNSTTQPIGPQGKLIAAMPPATREHLRTACVSTCRPPPMAASPMKPLPTW